MSMFSLLSIFRLAFVWLFECRGQLCKELILVTVVSETWGEVILRVKWKSYVSWLWFDGVILSHFQGTSLLTPLAYKHILFSSALEIPVI